MLQYKANENPINKGDLSAFEVFYKMNFERLVKYARLYLAEVNVCEDIVQESFYQLWIKRKDIDPLKPLNAFIFTTVRNKCLNELKHRKIHDKFINFLLHDELVEKFYQFDFCDASVDNSDSQKVFINIMHDAIEQLPPKRKNVFKLCKIEGLKNQEVAQIEGITIKGVEHHITKANKFIRDYLKTIKML